jgi:hypothetical protein
VLQGSTNRNIRASICDDQDNELIGYDLGHDVTAYPAGFTIGISQAIDRPGGTYPTDVAIASAVITTTNVPPSPHDATGIAAIFSGFLVSVTITDSGYGYTNTPGVHIIGGGGNEAGASAFMSNGVIASITVTNAGSGFTNTPIVVIDPPFVPSPVLNLVPVSLLTFSNLVLGNNYQLQQSMAWYWTNLPVEFTATSLVFAQIPGTTVGSFNYRLTFAPAPNQAFAAPQLINGFVVGATVTSGGSGYASNPSVSIVGGGGTGATAVSQVSGGVVTNISITGAGFGYSSTPVIQIAPPPVAALFPTALPGMRIDSTNLVPYNNYQIQFTPSLSGSWGNWNGGPFSPTGSANFQYFLVPNESSLFRLQYVP